MAPIQHFAPPAGIKAPPLSFATKVGDLLFVSGIPGFDDNGALPDSFEAQFGFVVRNIKRVLDEAGTDLGPAGQGQRIADARGRRRRDECIVCFGVRPATLPGPHHLRRSGAARSKDADRNRMRRIAGAALTLVMPGCTSWLGAASSFVIPGCAAWRRPGIHNHHREYGFRARAAAQPRNDGARRANH
jgi:hypothetical protein